MENGKFVREGLQMRLQICAMFYFETKGRKTNIVQYHLYVESRKMVEFICRVTDIEYKLMGASQVALVVKNLPANAGNARQVWHLGQDDTLEKERASHVSVLAWKIPRTEEPCGLKSMGQTEYKRVRAHAQTHTQTHTKRGEMNWETVYEIDN